MCLLRLIFQLVHLSAGKLADFQVRIKCPLVAKDMGSTSFDAAIQFALEIRKIQSKAEVDITKSTAGIDAFLLRNSQGATIATISKRVLKEKSENAAAAKAKDEFNANTQ